jgi:hypothetical protein
MDRPRARSHAWMGMPVERDARGAGELLGPRARRGGQTAIMADPAEPARGGGRASAP